MMHYLSSGIYYTFTDGGGHRLQFTIRIIQSATREPHTIYSIKQSVYASCDDDRREVTFILLYTLCLYMNINKLYINILLLHGDEVYVYNTKYNGLSSPPYIYTLVLVETRCVNAMFSFLLTVFLFFFYIYNFYHHCYTIDVTTNC